MTMMLDQTDPQDGPVSYRPSHQVAWGRCAGMFAIGAVLALGLAWLRSLTESIYPESFIVTLIAALPLLAATWGVVHFGHCRSPWVGMAIGVLLILIFFAATHVMPDLTLRPLIPPDAGPWYAIWLELQIVVLIIPPAAIGWRTARRVFFENTQQWATPMEFRLALDAAPLVLEAVEGNDWGTLSCLPRLSSALSGSTDSVLFLVEYAQNATDEPAYVTVAGPPMSGSGLVRRLRAYLGTVMVRQKRVEPDDVQMMVALFPDMNPAAASAMSNSFSPRPGSEADYPIPQFRGGIIGTLQRVGALPVRIKGPDFRIHAAAATDALLAEHPNTEPANRQASICAPVDLAARRLIAQLDWLQVVIGLATLTSFAAGLSLINASLRSIRWGVPTTGQTIGVVGGAILMALALAALIWILFVGAEALVQRMIVRRVAVRPGSLLAGREELPRIVLKIEDGHTHHVARLTPDDICICVMDAPNRRLLMEGLGFRYIVRGEDLRQLSPLRSGSELAIALEFVVASRTSLAVAMTPIRRGIDHLPFRSSQRRLEKVMHQLFATIEPQFACDNASGVLAG